jgi:hypothetical protein
VVCGNAIYGVEDQRHPAPAPKLVLAAQLASTVLKSGGVQALLKAAARVGRALDQDLFKWLDVSTTKPRR